MHHFRVTWKPRTGVRGAAAPDLAAAAAAASAASHLGYFLSGKAGPSGRVASTTTAPTLQESPPYAIGSLQISRAKVAFTRLSLGAAVGETGRPGGCYSRLLYIS